MLMSGTAFSTQSTSGDEESDSFIKPRMRKGGKHGPHSDHETEGSDGEDGKETRAKKYSKVQQKVRACEERRNEA